MVSWSCDAFLCTLGLVLAAPPDLLVTLLGVSSAWRSVRLRIADCDQAQRMSE